MTGCSGTEKAEAEALQVGLLRIDDSFPFYVAQKEGLFEKRLDLLLQRTLICQMGTLQLFSCKGQKFRKGHGLWQAQALWEITATAPFR